jgi:hypothetical protein
MVNSKALEIITDCLEKTVKRCIEEAGDMAFSAQRL